MKSTSPYSVIFEPYAERHYMKSFAKKYKGAWDITLGTIREEFRQIDLLFLKKVAETIVDGDIKICKTEFRVAGTKDSRHGSGNRCIVAVHSAASEVHMLLVYNKNDLGGHNETVEWKQVIKDNYPEYGTLL